MMLIAETQRGWLQELDGALAASLPELNETNASQSRRSLLAQRQFENPQRFRCSSAGSLKWTSRCMRLRRVSDMRCNIAVWARMRVSPCLCRAYIIAERASLSHICTILPTTWDAQLILHPLVLATIATQHAEARASPSMQHHTGITTAEINWTCVPDSVGWEHSVYAGSPSRLD